VPLAAFVEEHGDDGARLKEFQGDLAYELYECCSCEYIDLRSSRELSGATGFTVTFHAQSSSRAVPAWRRELPPAFTPILDELYVALNTESRVLAVMGARAVIDIVLRDKAADVVSFRGGLSMLRESGLLRERDREFLWNALVPDGRVHSEVRQAPMLDTLSRVMDILEELLHASYVQRDEKLLRPLRATSEGQVRSEA